MWGGGAVGGGVSVPAGTEMMSLPLGNDSTQQSIRAIFSGIHQS